MSLIKLIAFKDDDYVKLELSPSQVKLGEEPAQLELKYTCVASIIYDQREWQSKFSLENQVGISSVNY
jgi:hypothetical protein